MQTGAGALLGRRMLVAASLTVFAMFASESISQSFAEDSGHIDISDARLTPVSNGWQLDARAEIRLSPVMRAGLDSGVPLEFVVEVGLVQRRRWWFDHTVFVFERRYTLIYYELTRHYRLQAGPVEMIKGEQLVVTGKRAIDGEEASSRNFRSLLTALDQMGTLRGIALHAGMLPRDTTPAGTARLPATERLQGVLTIRLDDRALPLPLQPVFSSTWRLASEEYVWPLN